MSYMAHCFGLCGDPPIQTLPKPPDPWGGGGTTPPVDPLLPYVFCPPIPATAVAMSADAPVRITGQNFTAAMTVEMNGEAMAITAQTASEITFTAKHSTSPAGVETVVVKDGGVAIAQTCQFTYTAAPLMVLVCPLSPISAEVGAAALTVRANGQNFTSTCVGTIDGVDLPTVYVSPTQLNLTINPVPETVRQAIIGVRDTATGYVSTVNCPFDFLQTLIVPTIVSVTPDYMGRQGPTKTLTVIGTNFVASGPGASQVIFNVAGVLPTTFVSATELTAIADPNIMQVGGHQIYVANGPLTNRSPTYIVCNCVHNPTVSMLDITTVPSGGATPTTVKVIGSYYGDTAKVLVDGVEVVTNRLSGGTLEFTMPPEPAPVVRQISVRLGHDHPPPHGHDNVTVTVPPLSLPFTYT